MTVLLKEFDCENVTLFLVSTIGPDGKYLSDIREKSDAPILVLDYAPPDGFKPPAEVGIFTNRTNFRQALRMMIEWYGEDVRFIHDQSRACEQDVAVHIKESWQDVSSEYIRRNDYVLKGSSDRVLNMLDSLHEFRKYPPINVAAYAFQGRTGVVVGAGPSLDKNIKYLKEYRDKIVIAAVNSSLPALDKEGIVPDFVVVCEAKEVGKTIKDSPALPQTIMVPGLHVNVKTWDLPWKRIAPALSNEGIFGRWACKLFNVPPAPIGGSSCCLAAGILYMLGFGTIVLVGNDCAPADGSLYSRNSAFAGTAVDFSKEGVVKITKSEAKLGVEITDKKDRDVYAPMTETWSWDRTEKIQTLIIYDTLRQWFEDVGNEWADEKIRLVNSTEGGVHILNWEHEKLKTVLEQTETIDNEPFDVVLYKYLEKGSILSREKLMQEIENQIEGSKTIGNLAREGVSLCQRLLEIQSEIKETGGAGDLLDAYTWGDVMVARKNKDKKAFQVFKEMFSEIERGSGELKQKLIDTKMRVENE